jgi:hypothetical protein
MKKIRVSTVEGEEKVVLEQAVKDISEYLCEVDQMCGAGSALTLINNLLANYLLTHNDSDLVAARSELANLGRGIEAIMEAYLAIEGRPRRLNS